MTLIGSIVEKWGLRFSTYDHLITGYYQKSKEMLQKRLVKGIKIFLKKKNVNMFVNDIAVFLKNKKTKSINMVKKDIKIFQKMKNKG